MASDTPKPLTAGQRDILRILAEPKGAIVFAIGAWCDYPIVESQAHRCRRVTRMMFERLKRAALIEVTGRYAGIGDEACIFGLSDLGRAALRENSNAAE